MGRLKELSSGVLWSGNAGERRSYTFCTSNITWRCGIQTIIFNHVCALTDALATRRFVLLDKSKQLVKKSTHRKIQCGNSCRRIVTVFKLFGVVFIFGMGMRWRVARHFDTGGNNNHVSSIQYLTPLIFKASSMKSAFVLLSFPGHMSSDWSLQTTCLFLLNWQVWKVCI